jgi:osmotically-inducible protein OsmY
MRSLKVTLATVLLAVAGWAAGATGTQHAAPSKPAGKTAGPDTQIEKDIRARFAKSKIAAEKFQVHVQGGIATIEGKTDVIQHKGVATRLAKSGGAVAVVNRIEISEAARQKAAHNLEKGRRRAQIKRGEARSER